MDKKSFAKIIVPVSIIVSLITLFVILFFVKFPNQNSEIENATKIGFWVTICGTLLALVGIAFTIKQTIDNNTLTESLKIQKNEIEKIVTSKLLNHFAHKILDKSNSLKVILSTKKPDCNRCVDFVDLIIEYISECQKIISLKDTNKFNSLKQFHGEFTACTFKLRKDISKVNDEVLANLEELLKFTNDHLIENIV